MGQRAQVCVIDENENETLHKMAIGLRYFSPHSTPFLAAPCVCVRARFFQLPFLIDVFKCFWPFIDFVKRYLPLLLLLLLSTSFLLLLSVISSSFFSLCNSPFPLLACLLRSHFLSFFALNFLAPNTDSLSHSTFQRKQTLTHNRSRSRSHLQQNYNWNCWLDAFTQTVPI